MGNDLGGIEAWSRAEPSTLGDLVIRQRIITLASIAADHGSSISAREILLLLPKGAFASAQELVSFVERDSILRKDLVAKRGDIVMRGRTDLSHHRPDQLSLSKRRVALAQSFSRRLASGCPWIRVVGVSGSTSYGGTRGLDDLDFFIVTKRDRVWITLLIALLEARFHQMRNKTAPVLCFNRILEEGEAKEAFDTPQDPLFAREALNLRILEGHDFYRNLILSASWMEQTFPDLFQAAIRTLSSSPLAVHSPENRIWSLMNWIAYVGLAPYLTLVGLWRNNRLRRTGNPTACFRTIIGRGFFAYESEKFDLLKEIYRRVF